MPAIAPIVGDTLLGLLRLAHALAAALWVGGALVYALTPARPRPSSGLLRETFAAGVGVFVLTGTILAFQRLSSAPLPPLYVGLLAVKVGLGVWMFMLARQIGSNSVPRLLPVNPQWALAGVGIAIYGLAISLRAIYEDALRP